VAATAAVLGALALNLVGAHLIGGYQQALAAVPVLGPITSAELAAAGMSAAQVQPQSITESQDGISVTVTGAFADADRTTVFVEFGSPVQCLSRGGLFGDMYVTDSAGRAYPLIDSDGCPDSAFAVTFAALPNAEQAGTQHLVLHTMLTDQGNKAPFSPEAATGPSLSIPFTVSPGSDTRLVLPAAKVNQGNYFGLSSLTVSANGLDVQAVAKGSLINQLYRCAAATGTALPVSCPSTNVSFPGMYLIDPEGQREWPAASYNAWGKGWNGTLRSALGISPDGTQTDAWLFDLHGPGQYQLVFQWSPGPGPYTNSNFGLTEASWTITVP
jgi:hypothetical protein